MQERVAVVAVEGQKPIALYGVEPLNFTTQLNRSAVPARLSLVGRHSTIPLLFVMRKSYQSARAVQQSLSPIPQVVRRFFQRIREERPCSAPICSRENG